MGNPFNSNSCTIVQSGKKPKAVYALDRADYELIIDTKHLIVVGLTV